MWLVGTSRGTQSVAYLAATLAGDDAPDGLVLTATVLTDPRGRPVPDMLRLMEKLAALPRKQLLTFAGGNNVGDPCEARAYHGFNGLEAEVVARIAEWMLAR